MKKRRMPLICSFCNKSELNVECMVVGPNVFICNECVDGAVDVVEEQRLKRVRLLTAWNRAANATIAGKPIK